MSDPSSSNNINDSMVHLKIQKSLVTSAENPVLSHSLMKRDSLPFMMNSRVEKAEFSLNMTSISQNSQKDSLVRIESEEELHDPTQLKREVSSSAALTSSDQHVLIHKSINDRFDKILTNFKTVVEEDHFY